MKSKPSENQIKAIRFLANRDYGILCSYPGSGKTRVALNLIAIKKADKVLLVTTRLGIITWKDEIKKWETNFNYLDLHSLPNSRFIGDHKIDMITFDSIHGLAKMFSERKQVPWDMLIVDESMNIKESNTKRFTSIKLMANLFKYRFLLNASLGTESIENIWSQAFLCDFGLSLGSKTNFLRKYTYISGEGKRKSSEYQQQKVMNLIRPFTICLQKDFTTPDVEVITLDMPKNTIREYNLVKNGCSGIFEELLIKNSMMKLLMICSGFMRDDKKNYIKLDNNKLSYLIELVNKFNNEPVIINYYFQFELEILKNTFGNGVVFDHKQLHKWNKGEIPILFVQATSKALSANLQYGGRVMIWFSLIASFARYDQMNRRIFGRIGSRNDCLIYALVNKGRFDSRLLHILSEKKELSTNLIKKLINDE